MTQQPKDHSKDDLYKQSGVDIEEGERAVEWLKSKKSSYTGAFGQVVGGIGGFASLFKVDFSTMQKPHLVSCTDGVGTKVLLGLELGQLKGLGQDLVGMCINDLYTLGASPLFFLDYYATGHLNQQQFQEVLTGIQDACRDCNTALIGGETAEMPGLYAQGHFDMAGFVVGVVDEPLMLKPEMVKAGDYLFALPSSGFHSNGYSLLRKWLKDHPALIKKYGPNLLEPTRLYHQVPGLLRSLPKALHGLAHITGGGISGNLPRVFASDLQAKIDTDTLPTPAWMQELFREVGVKISAVEHVFNLGCGMIAMVDPTQAVAFTAAAAEMGLPATRIGSIEKRPAGQEAGVVYISGKGKSW